MKSTHSEPSKIEGSDFEKHLKKTLDEVAAQKDLTVLSISISLNENMTQLNWIISMLNADHKVELAVAKGLKPVLVAITEAWGRSFVEPLLESIQARKEESKP